MHLEKYTGETANGEHKITIEKDFDNVTDEEIEKELSSISADLGYGKIVRRSGIVQS